MYIRGKLDEGFYVGITGSNASMLSRELGTKLTGRHITKELFPFSYAEYCGFTGKTIGDSSLYDYLHQGGFPQYLQLDDQDVLTDLVNDIVYRDIAVRYNIRDDHSLKSLLAYLMGNVGNLVSATKLKQILGMKSTSTVSDYFLSLIHILSSSVPPGHFPIQETRIVSCRLLPFFPTLHRGISHTARRFRTSRNVRL